VSSRARRPYARGEHDSAANVVGNEEDQPQPPKLTTHCDAYASERASRDDAARREAP
jgi:hypothetical protein